MMQCSSHVEPWIESSQQSPADMSEESALLCTQTGFALAAQLLEAISVWQSCHTKLSP